MERKPMLNELQLTLEPPTNPEQQQATTCTMKTSTFPSTTLPPWTQAPTYMIFKHQLEGDLSLFPFHHPTSLNCKFNWQILSSRLTLLFLHLHSFSCTHCPHASCLFHAVTFSSLHLHRIIITNCSNVSFSPNIKYFIWWACQLTLSISYVVFTHTIVHYLSLSPYIVISSI